nr:ATP-binding protein [Neoroseomonas alba]
MDIAERRQAQDALLLAQAELAHAARAATLGELSASIAHEVNQPLMAVVTSGEAGLRWLRRDPPDLGEVDQSISRIVAEGRRAGQIVARIRSFVKKAPVQRDLLDAATFVEEAVLLVERELSAAQVALDVDVAPGLPMVLGDRIQLQQVLVNLMVNAGQAMAAQDRPRRLRVSGTRDEAGGIVLSVTDTGPGIAAEDLPRLFEPFFTTRQQGMGMGLAICRTTAEAHGGHLTVESRPGEGTAFRLWLPAATEEIAAP